MTGNANDQTIPAGVRGALLNWFEERGVPGLVLLNRVFQHDGHARFEDYIARMVELYGRPYSQWLAAHAHDRWSREAEASGAQGLHAMPEDSERARRLLAERMPTYLFTSTPDPEFASALTHAIAELRVRRERRSRARPAWRRDCWQVGMEDAIAPMRRERDLRASRGRA